MRLPYRQQTDKSPTRVFSWKSGQDRPMGNGDPNSLFDFFIPLTEEWWRTRRNEFELRISQFVVDEASAGDAEAAQERMAILAPLLDISKAAGSETEEDRGPSQRRNDFCGSAPSLPTPLPPGVPRRGERKSPDMKVANFKRH